MARISKEGIDYFPMDGDFLSNRKIRRLVREHGPEAIAVFLAVLAVTYNGKGYYMEWNEDVCFDLSEQTNTKTKTVQAIIVSAMHQQLFDTEMFKKQGIITSERIQKQYLQCTQKRKNVVLKEEYRLIAAPQTLFQEEEMGISAPQTIVSGTEIAQSKGKKIESKGKEKKTTPTPPGKRGDGGMPSGLAEEGGNNSFQGTTITSVLRDTPCVLGHAPTTSPLRGTPPRAGGEFSMPEQNKEEELILVNGRKVPQYCLNKRTHNYDGLLERLNQIHVTDVKVVNMILKQSDYGRIGHPLWGIISYNNWPTYGIKFPAKFILSQLKLLQ